MTETTKATIAELEAELIEIGRLMEDAAVRGDGESFVAIQMRSRAIPALIREERARPVRVAIERLEAELEALTEEQLRARGEPPQEVPAAQRGTVRPEMLQQRRLQGVTDRLSRVGRSSNERHRELAQILEAES